MARKKNLQKTSGKTNAKSRNKKCSDYSKVLKLQEERENLAKEKLSLEKRFSGMKIRIDENSRGIRVLKMKLENAGRQLMERLSELNLLEERLLIIEIYPVNDALSGAEQQLKTVNYNFGDISIKMVVISRNINRIRKDVSRLKSGKYDFFDIEKDTGGDYLRHTLKEIPWKERHKAGVLPAKGQKANPVNGVSSKRAVPENSQ